MLPTDYVDVEIVDSLMCIFTTVHDYAVAFNVLLAANFSDSDHQVANKCFIFWRLLHIIQRMHTELLRQEDKMDLSYWLLWGEDNHFVILEDHIWHRLLTFDYFVKGWILKLVESDFGLLHLWLILLAVFGLGPPFAHSKNWARLAKLGEDKIGVLVEGLELLG